MAESKIACPNCGSTNRGRTEAGGVPAWRCGKCRTLYRRHLAAEGGACGDTSAGVSEAIGVLDGMAEPPSRVLERPVITGVDEHGLTHWQSAEYYGCIQRFERGFPIGGGEYAVLSITAADDSARHDWREFQQLKNYLFTEEHEAVELYPAESRLCDPSNRFYLWVVPFGVIKWGLPFGRNVLDRDQAIAPQRPFGKKTS